ncbi:MAG TPA: fatty acid desaturase, partial [Oligoflexus sp.]|uniref:fatty acid desaturase n=1 Tax=Oligoflexus sp. TaxID=1971216 RepID=UPI002D3F9211
MKAVSTLDNVEASVSYFSREELKVLLERSNYQGWKSLAINWGIIILVLIAVALYPHPLLIIVGMAILAGRQLGLAILMHDCAHYSLFATKSQNQWVGRWLCGAPLLIDLDGYRSYHLKHHQTAGSVGDPDYPNYQNYPVSRKSFTRKVLRDLSGITGVKTLLILLSMSLGLADYTLAYKSSDEKTKKTFKEALNLAKQFLLAPLLFHLTFFALLFFLGVPWLHGLWLLTYLTIYMLVLRIRNAAEHAALPERFSPDPRL